MSSANNANASQSQPIHIDRRRQRSGSESSVDSDLSEATPTPAASADGSPPRVKVQTSPSTSPILSYFFPASPTAKSPIASFVKANPVLEDDEADNVLPASAHARRLSNTWGVGTRPPLTNGDDRSTGLLRRLSLGSAFGKPPMASAGAGGPTGAGAPALAQPIPRANRPRRSTTVAVAGTTGATVTHKPRAPSPMGERILKGHFDGFV